MVVQSKIPVPDPNGIAGPNPIATQTEGQVMEKDIPRDNEEDVSVSNEEDEAPQEQVQSPTTLSAEPEIDLSAPPEDLDIPEPENENQVSDGSVALASENEYPEYEVQDVEEDEDDKALQEESEPGGFPWNDDFDDYGPSPAPYWGISQDPVGNGDEAPTVPPPSPTAGTQGNRNCSRQNGTSGAIESARLEKFPSRDRTGTQLEEWGDQIALIHEKIGHLPPAYRKPLLDMLLSKDIVAWCLEDLRLVNVQVTHSFDLSQKHNLVVRDEIDKMLKTGIIRPSLSTLSLPVVIATKKARKPLFCVDYPTLNKVMTPDRWHLPKIEEMLEDLSGSR